MVCKVDFMIGTIIIIIVRRVASFVKNSLGGLGLWQAFSLKNMRGYGCGNLFHLQFLSKK